MQVYGKLIAPEHIVTVHSKLNHQGNWSGKSSLKHVLLGVHLRALKLHAVFVVEDETVQFPLGNCAGQRLRTQTLFDPLKLPVVGI